MDQEKPTFLLARYHYRSDLTLYHAYGNTPPHDLLENCADERDPMVLVLGSGDIRSCFYSLWKNSNTLTSNDSNKFHSIEIVVNDISAAVLARNILFLHLCLQMPEGEEAMKKWLSSVWAIWYCHELYPEHCKVLDNSLHILCKHSVSWESKDNPLYPMIKFSSLSTLKEIAKVWKMWLDHKVGVKSVKEMHSSRRVLQSSQCGNDTYYSENALKFINLSTKIPGEYEIKTSKHDMMMSEIASYGNTGNLYAEKVLGTNLPNTSTCINYTFYEREDGKYTLYHRSLPFSCYYHTAEFSNESLSMKSMASATMLVGNKHFNTQPFLANSVQQLCMWFQATKRILISSFGSEISFTFDCSHAIMFCSKLEESGSQFDVIYTSNLIDQLGPPNLVLSAAPLLKANGHLFTTTLLYNSFFTSVEQLLNSSFGFDCKLLPIVLGIRCINHEGDDYVSPVMIQPCSLTLGDMTYVMHSEKLLIWKRVDSLPLVIPFGDVLPNIFLKALLNAMETLAYPLLRKPPGVQMLSHLCVETAVKIIQVFISNTSANFTPQFWSPLSLSAQKSVKSYLSSIQTQLFLHGIHMHLTVTDETCPFCQNVSLTDFIGSFSITISSQSLPQSPRFTAFVHKEEIDSAQHLCNIAEDGKNIHMFDCVSSPANGNDGISICFHAPQDLMKEDYKVTLISFNFPGVSSNNICHTQMLKDLEVTSSMFRFSQACTPCVPPVVESFGEITSFLSDGDITTLEVSLYDSVVSALAVNRLQPKRISSSEIQLKCDTHVSTIKLPHPTEYNQISIKVSKKTKNLSMKCPRSVQLFDEEKPIFNVDLNNEMSLLPRTISKKAMGHFYSQQYTMDDCRKMKSTKRTPSLFSPILNVKRSFSCLFGYEDVQFFDFICPESDVYALVVINNRLFDYEKKSPVLDLAFYFWDESFDIVKPVWDVIRPVNFRNIHVSNKDEFESLKKVLCHFINRTLSKGTSSNLLAKHGIERYFTRAVVYPLYNDQDHPNDKKKDDNKVDAPFHPFPLARYWYDGDFRFYYAYGNTPAEDFLENCTGVEEPTVLSLGCGDIRSCFYTLWKNFDFSISDAPKRFSGVHFVMNDCSAAVLARNIIFLHLCLQLPENVPERKQWLSAMWAIWYCHELYPDHQRILENSLKLLLKFSKSPENWAKSDNPLQHLIKFTSSDSLAEISQVWKMWFEKKIVVASVHAMHENRRRELMQRGVLHTMDLYASSYTFSIVHLNGDSSNTSKKATALRPEVISYIKSGNCYAESVLNIKLEHQTTGVNHTFYERPDGVYNLHYGSMPFSGYYHTIDLSPSALKSNGIGKKLCDAMFVSSKSFKSLPFLANSVQQFTMWLQSANKVLSDQENHISFTFNCSDALSFCLEVQFKTSSLYKSRYDLIYTSNLMDHLGPPNVILSTVPLLKKNGLLFTTTLLYRQFVSTVEEFLEKCFGFNCKFLPVILGVRCINHEGKNYASPVMLKPTPMSMGDIIQVKRHERLLVWEKISAQPLVLSQLPKLKAGNVTDALFDHVQISAFSFIKSSEGRIVLNNVCIETAICLLQTFLSLVTADSSDYHFWDHLSSSLKHSAKPFLTSLQTQALLNNLHIHLAVTEDDCLLCKHTPIEKTIGLFCATLQLPLRYLTPNFIAIIHKYSSHDAQYLCNEANKGKDVHIIDCVDGNVESNTLELSFFAPLKFMIQGYSVTVAVSWMQEEKNVITCVVPTSSMKSFINPFVQYSFHQIMSHRYQIKTQSDSFGVLASHIYDGEEVRSEITLSNSALKALSFHKLKTKKLSSKKLELMCDSLHYILDFVYPIDNHFDVLVSTDSKKVEVIAHREAHHFEEEKPLFVISPDHQLSIPPQNVSRNVMENFAELQITPQERLFPSHSMNKPILLKLKLTLYAIYQKTDHFFFRFISLKNSLSGVIVVNNVLMDYQNKVPVIDLAFCFLDTSDASDRVVIENVWTRMTRMKMVSDIMIDDAQYEVLKTLFFHFSERTNGTCQTAGCTSRLNTLCELKIDKHFIRAAICLLFCDPDHAGSDVANEMSRRKCIPPVMLKSAGSDLSGNPDVDEKCDYCGKYCMKTKRCSKCKNTHYCSKSCQTKHWQEHSTDCKRMKASKLSEDTTTLSANGKYGSSKQVLKCSHCNKSSNSLKKCLQCGKAQYCGKECQTQDWARHKLECKKLAGGRVSSTTKNLTILPQGPTMTVSAKCANCGIGSIRLLSCGRCGVVKYCGKECQRNHWKEHKLVCKQV